METVLLAGVFMALTSAVYFTLAALAERNRRRALILRRLGLTVAVDRAAHYQGIGSK